MMTRRMKTCHSVWKRRVVPLYMTALLLAALFPSWVQAKGTPQPHHIDVMATARKMPPRITLDWPLSTGSGGVVIYRKALAATSWGSVYATVTEDDRTLILEDAIEPAKQNT